MKRRILLTFLLSFGITPLQHFAEEKPLQNVAVEFPKQEWLEKFYQANRDFESIDIWFDILKEDGTPYMREHFVVSSKRKLILGSTFRSTENLSVQAVSHYLLDNGKLIDLDYFENRTPNLISSSIKVRDGRAMIRNGIPEGAVKAGKFFYFDSGFHLGKISNKLKSLSPQKLRESLSEIEYKGKKCLKFSEGPITLIFEKERGVVLERSKQSEGRLRFIEKYEYSDYEIIDGIWFPTKVRHGYVQEKCENWSTYRFSPKDVKLNQRIPDSEFVLTIPKGFQVYDQINNTNYLATGFSKEEEKAIQKHLDEILEEAKKPKQ